MTSSNRVPTSQADGHGRSRRRRSMEEAEFHAAALRIYATTVWMFPQQTCVTPQKNGDLSHNVD